MAGAAYVTAIVGSAGGTAAGSVVSALSLTAGANATGYDFGVQSGVLVGRVYMDTNGNGKFDVGDVAAPNLTIVLTTPPLGGSGSPTTTKAQTDTAGLFRI